ncbi:ABC transporter permease [Clostridium tertium]|jgi:sodium transport system permease protein|uniref:ABC transporter permease n=1 Tax=Clostridium TaxID=1485 RepID=UPI00115BB321|nr:MULTISPECIES: ABC transporter permease [Clostridium]MBP1868038.1 sodium transport system permease protein [Clostridium tertium]MBS5307182.1 ABC transporter permease [Clostridium sp.]MDB1923006.1 ABC transporter permease [Clostridium tertium]MDB1926159.1 ABC transporter permease [Clostridium tertium]MDB1930462.1 ABC transporter permease [Clostridium tertium]
MNNFLTVLKKELLDIVRDKKTLVFTLILPILIYPIMFKFMSSAMEKTQSDVQKEINIYIDGDKNSSMAKAITSLDNIKLPEIESPTESLKNGDIQLIVKIPENFDENISQGKNDTIELLIDEESNKSMIASSMVNEIYESYKKSIVEQRLADKGIDSSILTPFEVSVKSGINADNEDINGGAAMLLTMIPTLIVILMVSSTVGMAADLGAGEKERFTFEPLLSTSAKRASLLWGKIGALCTVSFIALMANLTAMVISMQKFMIVGEEVNFKLTPATILGMLIIGALVLITLSALQISVSIYARSTKEANSYLAAITMPTMILAFLPYMMDAKGINPAFFNIPITNAICLMKEFTVGIFDIKHIAIVVGWHIVYIIASIIFAKFMFSKEEVIFRN